MDVLGQFDKGDIIYLPWSSYDSNGASVDPSDSDSDFGSIKIYKKDSTTELTTPGVVTEYHNFDGITGNHLIVIDTSVDETFFADGNEYSVCLIGATIDGQVVNAVLATFTISGELSTGSVERSVWQEGELVTTTVYFYDTRV